MASHGGTTTDHDEIRQWAEARGARPSRVVRTGDEDPEVDPGIIRLDFPGYTGAGALEEITWDEWFRAFEDGGLAFIHQDETKDGEQSNFNRLVKRETVEARLHGDSHANARSTGTSRRGAKEATARKATARKSAPAKSTAKKAAAKRATAKKAASKKASAKAPAAKRPAARKSTAKKSTAKKATAKKTVARKSAAKAGARRPAAKKAAATKAPARRAPAKKAAGRTAAAKRPAARRGR